MGQVRLGCPPNPQLSDEGSVCCVQAHSDLPVRLSGRSVHHRHRGSGGENQVFTAGEQRVCVRRCVLECVCVP